jgi:hypothetical protein
MVKTRRVVAPGQLFLGLDADPVGIAAELTRSLVEQSPGSLVIPELGLPTRRARVDIAHVTDHLAGFEIKGCRDELDRLDHQQDAFSSTFEQMTLVAAGRHVARAQARIPSWWGLIAVGPEGLGVLRLASRNPTLDRAALAALLWRDEAAAVLRAAGRRPGRMTRPEMVEIISVEMTPVEISRAVCAAFRARREWRIAA